MSASGHGILQDEYRKYGMLLDNEAFKMFDDPELQITSVINRAYAVSRLNDGVSHEILMRFESNDGEELWFKDADMCADKYAVYLGVYSMERGVKIEEADMGILRSVVKRVELHQEAKEQVEYALTHYKSNGDGWNFKNYPTGYNPNPNSSIPADGMDKDDKSFQAFYKQHIEYMKEKAAKEMGPGNQDKVDDGEDLEEA